MPASKATARPPLKPAFHSQPATFIPGVKNIRRPVESRVISKPIMIGPDVSNGGETEKVGVLALMRSLERELAAKPRHLSPESMDLYFEALDARSEEDQFEMVHRAFQLDPGNIDAILLLLGYLPMSPDDEIELLRKTVALGEHQLGEKLFQDCAGHFWGIFETRPYMRAREQLAASLRDFGELEAAIREWQAMLELNPFDNQGIRHSLLPALLTAGDIKAAAALQEKYEDARYNTVFAWCRVLERFLSGDPEGADEALAHARRQNPNTEFWLRGRRKLPNEIPDMYSPGSREEALFFAQDLREAWEAHPEARAWLLKQKSPS